ncbi:hypothetical protein TNCV_4454661 [Trichonephila clavipes]|nr:hypothetical protein TNCV_4454661 [Trichonephila clavipes]
MQISTDGQRNYTNECPHCPNVQLSLQHVLIYSAIQARLFKISPKYSEDLIFSDEAVEDAEAVFDSFGVI